MKKQIKYIVDYEFDYTDQADLLEKMRTIRTSIKQLMKTDGRFKITKIKTSEDK